MNDPNYPYDYKKLHGAPYRPNPGPWPYLWAIIAAVVALALILTTAP